jgi:hypothetical protein
VNFFKAVGGVFSGAAAAQECGLRLHERNIADGEGVSSFLENFSRFFLTAEARRRGGPCGRPLFGKGEVFGFKFWVEGLEFFYSLTCL